MGEIEPAKPTAVGLALDVVKAIDEYMSARVLVEGPIDDNLSQTVLARADNLIAETHKLLAHLAALSENDNRPELAIERTSKSGRVSRVTLAKLERERVAREITTRYYDWIKEQTGRGPILTFPAIAKIVETAYQRGWDPREIVIAMGELYRAGATLTGQALERQLDGRARRRAAEQPRTATGRAMANLRDRMQKGATGG